MSEEELYKLRDTAFLARYLGVCEKTMRRLMKDGEVRACKVGNRWRSSIQAVHEYLGGLGPSPS